LQTDADFRKGQGVDAEDLGQQRKVLLLNLPPQVQEKGVSTQAPSGWQQSPIWLRRELGPRVEIESDLRWHFFRRIAQGTYTVANIIQTRAKHTRQKAQSNHDSCSDKGDRRTGFQLVADVNITSGGSRFIFDILSKGCCCQNGKRYGKQLRAWRVGQEELAQVGKIAGTWELGWEHGSSKPIHV